MPLNYGMLANNEEIADLKAEINVLEAKINVLEGEIKVLKDYIEAREVEVPRDMAYIIELRRELVASKNELVELRKEKNILLRRKVIVILLFLLIWQFLLFF